MTRRAGDPRGKGTSAWVTAVRERVFNNATEKLLMMCLCDYIDGDDTAYAGAGRTLAPDVGVDPRTIKRTLGRLESVGVIERVRRQYESGRGGRAPDAIRFCWDGFLRLPLVQYEVDKMSPNPPDDPDKMSPKPGGYGDTGIQVWGSSAPPSSYRTPLEPPTNTTPPTPTVGVALELVSAHSPAQAPVLPETAIFKAWIDATGRTGATILTTKRRKKIKVALRDYPFADVLDAVYGWRNSPYHCGENDTGTVYNDLETILRDGAQVEKFRDLHRNGPAPKKAVRAPIQDAAAAYLASRREQR